MDILMKIAEQYGLFVVAVVYIIWDSRQREARYIEVIEKLSDSFDQIKSDVELIKKKLWD
jgi:hypothetical protein